MQILPQQYSEFKEKSYWNHFFASLKNTDQEFFEWYGTFKDYEAILNTLLEDKEKIFHVGCGKSVFSQSVLAAKPNSIIINCDYSEMVISQMKHRNEQLKLKMEYVVLDLLKPLPPEYLHTFSTVLDKGTLDALLPEDDPINIEKIKCSYFNNIVQSLSPSVVSLHSKIIIISLLQPFVLKALLQYFVDKFDISIYENHIANSKLQPFLVCLTAADKPKAITIQTLDSQLIQLATVQQTLKQIATIQENTRHGGNIKKLMGGQRIKYNVYAQNNNKLLRYVLEIVDSSQKQVLLKNSCSVFIVPQGKENSYLFNDDEGIQKIVGQVGSSRLILAKMITGSTFEDLNQVKSELNAILPDLIQNGCNPSQVPYLTDADELGHRSNLFENDEIVIDEVIVEKEPYRRLFVRSNITVPQCSFKLTYLNINHPHYVLAKNTNSKILPEKKNMFIGIDKQACVDDNAQLIYSGIAGYIGNKKLDKGCKVLVIGCQIALAKFIYDTHDAVSVTIVIQQSSFKGKILQQYCEVEETGLMKVVVSNPEQYFKDNLEQKFDVIVMATNEMANGPNPVLKYTQHQFLKEITDHLVDPGLFVCQYWQYSWVPYLGDFFFPVFTSGTNSREDNILFGLQYPRLTTAEGKTEIHESLISLKSKSKQRFEWEGENFKDLSLIFPNLKDGSCVIVSGEEKCEDPYESEKSKNKKKKKKK